MNKYFLGGYKIRMLEITIDNCYKCDLETINDPTVIVFGSIEEI